jgi:hypothetical protein
MNKEYQRLDYQIYQEAFIPVYVPIRNDFIRNYHKSIRNQVQIQLHNWLHDVLRSQLEQYILIQLQEDLTNE